MHKIKQIRDELLEEVESYKGAIKDGDEHDAMCVKCLASAADHLDAILERHGMLDDEDMEQESSKRRMRSMRSYAGDPTGARGYDDAADRVERGRAYRSGSDRSVMRKLEKLGDEAESPEVRNAIMQAMQMAQSHM